MGETTILALLSGTLTLLGLAAFGVIGIGAAALAWLLLAVTHAGVVALRRTLVEPEGAASARGADRDAARPPAESPAVLRLRRALEQHRETPQDGLIAGVLESVLDGVGDPLVVFDARCRVTQANAAARRLFPAAEIGTPLLSVMRDPAVTGAVEAALSASVGSQVTLNLIGTPPRAFSVKIAPLEAGSLGAHVLIALRERTEQVQIERMRSDFVANASHELRTPLAAIRGFIETLQGPARDDAAARDRFLAVMAKEAERMGRLLDDLLSLSRIELAEHQPPRETVLLAPIVAASIDRLAPLAARHRVTLAFEGADAAGKVAADGDQLGQVAGNLVENAIRYGGEGKTVRIAVRAEAAAPPGAGPLTGRRALALAVADEGPGIPAALIPRVTERFFRVDAARSRQVGGTGLGLAIVKHILRRHQGHLHVASELGQGSTFTVYLPRADG